MPKQKLTAKFVENAKAPAKGRIEYFDSLLPGFGLRVSSSGRKSWVVFYRVKKGPEKGAQRRMTIEPPFPATGLASARKAAGEIMGEVETGKDPAKDKQENKQAPAPARPKYVTFGDVVAGFVDLYAKPRQRTWKETERTLRKNCADWLDRPIAGIAKADAYDLLDGFVAAGHWCRSSRWDLLHRRPRGHPSPAHRSRRYGFS